MSKISTLPAYEKADEHGGKFYLPDTDIEIPAALAELLIPIDMVRDDPANPRITKDLEALVKGVRRFGFRQPAIANKNNAVLEAGHQRKATLKKMGAKHIPVIWVDDDNITATAFNISDNRTAEVVAGWDEDALSRLYATLEQEDALEGVGFTDESLNALRLEMAEGRLANMDGFSRDATEARGKELQDEHGSKGKPKGDGNWFYVEFYGEDSLFEVLKDLLKDYMATGHELNPDFFASLVRDHFKKEGAE